MEASEEDVASLYGDVDAEAVCRSWLNKKTMLVVLTRGATGAVIFSRAVGRVDIPPIDTIVTDTVGAGDSFMAALLAMLTIRKWDNRSAISSLTVEQITEIGAVAATAAALTCSRRGPALPTLRDLRAFGANID